MKREKIIPPSPETLSAVLHDPDFPTRSNYAHLVLQGKQALSGGDLKGKAKKYGGNYARMRGRVIHAALKHGIRLAYDADDGGRLKWTVAPEPQVEEV